MQPSRPECSLCFGVHGMGSGEQHAQPLGPSAHQMRDAAAADLGEPPAITDGLFQVLPGYHGDLIPHGHHTQLPVHDFLKGQSRAVCHTCTHSHSYTSSHRHEGSHCRVALIHGFTHQRGSHIYMYVFYV